MDSTWAADGAAHATGAARRRRERRLRAYLRYARMSGAVALAEARRHTAPRGQNTARSEATFRSQRTSVAGDTELFSLFEEELGSTRQAAGAAHRGALGRRLALRADSRCSCAADGERAVGRLQTPGHRVA